MMMSQELRPEDKRKKLIITDATKRKVNTHPHTNTHPTPTAY